MVAPKDDGVTWLEALTRFGVDYTIVQGWETRGNLPFNPIGCLVHHTASDDTRLSIIVDGVNQGGGVFIPGPLVQFYIEDTPSNAAWVVAGERRANHAGQGDPAVLDRMAADLPVLPNPGPDQANTGSNEKLWGVELEGNGPEDFQPGTYVYDTAVKVYAAQCWWRGWNPLTRVAGHKEWTRRKVDPAFDMDTFRAAVAATIESEDDMAFLPITPTSDAATIAWLQRRLRTAVAPDLVPDGKWGSATEAAVALIPDATPAVVGGNDWANLEELYVKALAGGSGEIPPHSHKGTVTVT